MKCLAIFALTLTISLNALAETEKREFDIQKEKIGSSISICHSFYANGEIDIKSRDCLESTKQLSGEYKFLEDAHLMAQIDSELAKKILDHFTRFDLKHLGVSDVESSYFETRITGQEFFAKIVWQAPVLFLKPVTTLYIQGYINEDGVQVTSFSDGTTDQKMESLRWMETSARESHIQYLYGEDADIDAKTFELLNDLVAKGIQAHYSKSPVMLLE